MRLTFRVQLALACITVTATLWAGSGTLSPYMGGAPRLVAPSAGVTGGSTSTISWRTRSAWSKDLKRRNPADYRCDVVVSTDHSHHVRPFALLAGQPREQWEQSVVLRRILYPVLAYPLASRLGIVTGGFLTNIWLHIATMIAFALYLRRRRSETEALVATWLIATYPGVSYWGGLPYAYAAIVPATLMLTVLLMEAARPEQREAKALVYALIMGIVCLAYDLFLVFGPALVFVWLWRRRWRTLVLSPIAILLPNLIWLQILKRGFGVAMINANTEVYKDIISAYLHPTAAADWASRWAAHIVELPEVATSALFYANFVVLPSLFLVALWLGYRRDIRLTGVEGAIGLSALCFFLFINCAPAYDARWQLRGSEYVRYFQPLFVVFVLYVARWFTRMVEEGGKSLLVTKIGLGTAFAASLSIVYGPWLDWPHSRHVYDRFYMTGLPTMDVIGEHFGRRPLWVCWDPP